MANFVIKESPPKIDPKRPESDPSYEMAKRAAAREAPKLKFEDRGQEEAYRKAVASNPANIFGLPAFYPPLQIQPSRGFGLGKEAETMPCGHQWIRKTENRVYSCRHGHEFIQTSEGETTQWSQLS